MRKIVCILMCLSMASMVSAALSITNGDFEALGIREDVPDWYDYNDGEGAAGTYIRLLHSLNDTQYMGFAWEDTWAYQSIGYNTENVPALQVQYEIAAVEPFEDVDEDAGEPVTNPRNLVLTVSLYESDGSFEGADGTDIDGADGVTLIDSVEVSYPAMAVGQDVVTDSVILNYVNATSGELFLRFENTGDGDATVGSGDLEHDTNDRFSIDNVQIVELASVVNPLPKEDTEFVATELDSAENDLIFEVADDDIVGIEVLFAPDPNVQSIKTIESVTPGQYTVTLEGELTEDLEWSTDYFWQVLAYEPNSLGGGGLFLKYTSPVWSYTTIQEGPYLGDVTPVKQGVWSGENAVFSVEDYSKADTFQWRYYPAEGEPNVALTDGADYTGVNTDTLTILNAQPDDAGFYYCVGTETATDISAESTSSGKFFIKELKAYYPFETVDGGYTPDLIGGKNMELIGGASLSDANSFDGKNLLLVNPGNQWARIADTSVADYEDITISFWFHATTLDRWAPIFEFGAGSTDYIMFTPYYRQDDPRQNGLDVARCEFRYPNPEDSTDILNPELDAESKDISAGKWYHIAITIEADEDGEGGSGRIYLGGQQGTEYETPQVLNVPTMTQLTKQKHYIGKRFSFVGDPLFNGRIDEFKIYNYARTKEEIAQEYFEGDPDTGTLCDMEIYDLYDYDFNDNCIVDLPDFAEIASRWLDSYRIYPD